jgi:hypothetical protein
MHETTPEHGFMKRSDGKRFRFQDERKQHWNNIALLSHDYSYMENENKKVEKIPS